jgi:hypothetical protein
VYFAWQTWTFDTSVPAAARHVVSDTAWVAAAAAVVSPDAAAWLAA